MILMGFDVFLEETDCRRTVARGARAAGARRRRPAFAERGIGAEGREYCNTEHQVRANTAAEYHEYRANTARIPPIPRRKYRTYRAKILSKNTAQNTEGKNGTGGIRTLGKTVCIRALYQLS